MSTRTTFHAQPVPPPAGLGGFGETRRLVAVDLAASARSIADDVNHVCGQERCIGSLSLAVSLLSQAVQELLVVDKPERIAP